MAVNKLDVVVTELAKIRGSSKAEATSILKDVAKLVAEALSEEGDVVKLPPLGTFKVVHKPSRNCRNPRTGEAIVTKAKDVIKFTS